MQVASHTMFLYCDLVQNQTLGDKQTALLRSIPGKFSIGADLGRDESQMFHQSAVKTRHKTAISVNQRYSRQ